MREPFRWQELAEKALLAGGIVLFVFFLHHGVAGDGEIRYQTLVRLAEHGEVRAEGYQVMQALLSLPVYAAGKLLGDHRRLRQVGGRGTAGGSGARDSSCMRRSRRPC